MLYLVPTQYFKQSVDIAATCEMLYRSFVPDQKEGGAFTRALVAAVRAAKKANPAQGISNADLMKAIDATLAEGAFKMTPALCTSEARAARPFFEV
jgi:hypothetical protein